MIILGLLLIGAAAAVLADVYTQNAASISVHAFGTTFTGRPGTFMIVGAGVGLATAIGVLLLSDGSRRRRRRRIERRELARERDAVAAERDAMAARAAEAEQTVNEERVARADRALAADQVAERDRVASARLERDRVARGEAAVEEPAEPVAVAGPATASLTDASGSRSSELVPGQGRRRRHFRKG